MLHWNDYAVVLAVARTPTLTAAANELGVALSTIMRRVEQIERRAGLVLFHKTVDGHMPTPLGEAIVSRAIEMEGMVSRAEHDLATAHRARETTVRIAASEVIAPFFVARHLPDIQQACPKHRIELTVSDQSPSATAHNFDISLWPAAPSDQNLFGRKLTALKWARFAAVSAPSGEDVEPYDASEVIEFFGRDGAQKIMSSLSGNDAALAHRRPLATNTLISAAAMAASGASTAFLPCVLGCTWPNLRQISEAQPHEIGELWAIYRKDDAHKAVTRKIVSALLSAAKKDRHLLCPA